ncbi:MAG: hypothetical protein K0S11_774 [Gammaproteobacteria bacterium]|jgi:hypothetical protein|nr:hypothetical protein [Gammaproteobacteria bacterium]
MPKISKQAEKTSSTNDSRPIARPAQRPATAKYNISPEYAKLFVPITGQIKIYMKQKSEEAFTKYLTIYEELIKRPLKAPDLTPDRVKEQVNHTLKILRANGCQAIENSQHLLMFRKLRFSICQDVIELIKLQADKNDFTRTTMVTFIYLLFKETDELLKLGQKTAVIPAENSDKALIIQENTEKSLRKLNLQYIDYKEENALSGIAEEIVDKPTTNYLKVCLLTDYYQIICKPDMTAYAMPKTVNRALFNNSITYVFNTLDFKDLSYINYARLGTIIYVNEQMTAEAAHKALKYFQKAKELIPKHSIDDDETTNNIKKILDYLERLERKLTPKAEEVEQKAEEEQDRRIYQSLSL